MRYISVHNIEQDQSPCVQVYGTCCILRVIIQLITFLKFLSLKLVCSTSRPYLTDLQSSPIRITSKLWPNPTHIQTFPTPWHPLRLFRAVSTSCNYFIYPTYFILVWRRGFFLSFFLSFFVHLSLPHETCFPHYWHPHIHCMSPTHPPTHPYTSQTPPNPHTHYFASLATPVPAFAI